MSFKRPTYALPAIPTRFIYSGDVEQCKALRGIARKYLAQLTAIDAPNKYNKYLQDNRKWPTIKSNRGDLIAIQMIKGVSVIEIHAPLIPEKPKKPIETMLCYCDCAITTGKVTYSPANESEDTSKWSPSSDTQYSCKICRGTRLATFDSITPLDFFAHRDSEPKVIKGVRTLTRKNDSIYGVIEEKDIDSSDPITGAVTTIHKRLPDLSACSWVPLALLSIEPLPEQMKLEYNQGM